MPEIVHLPETDSTNRYMREWVAKSRPGEGSVVYADVQTAGRGQPGNRWESEAGANLTFSTVLYPGCIPASSQFLLSQVAALSVKETLERHVSGVSVKWPNDVYCGDRKICGMLIENDLAGSEIYCSIIGIGINLNQETFYSDAPNPVSLRQLTGKRYNREEELHAFLHRFYRRYLQLLQGRFEAVRNDYRAALYRGDGFYPYTDAQGAFEARIHDIEPTGHLLLALPGGEIRRYAFKEVACAGLPGAGYAGRG